MLNNQHINIDRGVRREGEGGGGGGRIGLMGLEGQEEEEEIEIGIPVSVGFGSSSSKAIGGNGTIRISTKTNSQNPPIDEEERVPVPVRQKAIKYQECLKNHAASIGGHALDGCCEFMPSGEEGSLEALKCAACSCHRNFHRRESEDEVRSTPPPLPPSAPPNCYYCYNLHKNHTERKIKNPFNSLPAQNCPPLPLGLPSTSPVPQMIMAFGGGGGGGGATESSSEDLNNNNTTSVFPSNAAPAMVISKKRFRTKFSQDQKEKMLGFADKVGWRIQKQDEEAVQQFCGELGIKRHVLKVWMHNNKHTMKKPQ